MTDSAAVISSDDNGDTWEHDKSGCTEVPISGTVLESDFIYSLSAYAGWFNILIP